MVDYTQQKLRSIIYKERKDLDEFDVDNEKSLDYVMLERIEKSPVTDMEDAPRYILDIFNQVYYIITLILMEKRPVHYFMKYVDIARHTSSYYYDMSRNGSGEQIFECVIMAMVYNYLQKFNVLSREKVKAFSEKIVDRYQSFKVNNEMRIIYCKCVIPSDELDNYKIDTKVFAPLCRPTDKEAQRAPANQLEEQEEKYRKLANDYVELEKEMEEIKIKFNEEVERKSKEPPYNSILSSDKKDDENVTHLQQQLKEAQKRIAELEQEVKKLKEQDEEEFENIDANQKIRMEIVYRLMRKAGMNPRVVKKQKIAEFMSMLLYIKSNNARGNEAQTCATYISGRLNDINKDAFRYEKYKDVTDNIKKRAKDLGMDISHDDFVR